MEGLNKWMLDCIVTIVAIGISVTVAAGEQQAWEVILNKASEQREIEGPYPPLKGLAAGEEIEVHLSEPLGERGTITLWLYFEQTYRAGPFMDESERYQVLAVPGAFHMNMLIRGRDIRPQFFWDDDALTPLQFPLPGLKQGWHHFAYVWDAEEGRLDGYLNGAPMRHPGTRVSPWEIEGASTTLRLPETPFGIADVRVHANEALSKDEIRDSIPPLYLGSTDRVAGAFPAEPINVDELKGELIHENPLREESDVAGWTLEGPGQVEFCQGWMVLSSEYPDVDPGHIVYWTDQVLPESYIVEWDVQILSEAGLNIVIFSATGRDGQADIFGEEFEERDGTFSQYHSGDLDNYHISYYAENPRQAGRATANLRKNHGFTLASNGPAGIGLGDHDVHRISLIKRGPHIQLAVDGNVVIDFRDDDEEWFGPAHGGGALGFRQMQWTEARYRNLQVYEVVEP